MIRNVHQIENVKVKMSRPESKPRDEALENWGKRGRTEGGGGAEDGETRTGGEKVNLISPGKLDSPCFL